MSRVRRGQWRVGSLPLAAALSLIAIIATASLSFISLVPERYIPAVALGANALLVLILPVAAGIAAVLKYTAIPQLRAASFSIPQIIQIAAAGAFIGWLDVATVSVVGVAGAVTTLLWLIVVFVGRLNPALAWERTDDGTRTDAGNIFPTAVTLDPAPDFVAPAPESFWVLVPDERHIVDDNGETLFTVGPSAWALAVGYTDTTLTIRDFSGREGQLTDITGVIRN